MLDTYCKKWNLSNALHKAKTPTSDIYEVRHGGRLLILKLLNEVGKKHEATGAVALRCFDGNGAVEILQADEGAHLLAFIDGHHLKELVGTGLDETATKVICEVIAKLHSYAGPIPIGLPMVAQNFRALFAKAKTETDDSIYVDGAKIAERLIQTAKSPRLLHGDIHHKNILKSKSLGWLAIDPQCLVGEGTYDLANSFYNPDDMPELVEDPQRILSMSKTFAEFFNIDQQRVLQFAFAYGCLSAAWCLEDGQNPERRLRIANKIFRLLRE